MEALKLDRTKLITPSAYAKKMGESPQLIKYWMDTGKVKVVRIEGAKLIYLG